MKVNLWIINPSQWIITSLSILITLTELPSYGANFITLSQTSIKATNFNQIPQNVGSIFDVKAIDIAEVGLVQSFIDIDSAFAVQDSSVVAHSNILINTFGTGIRYQQNINIGSTLIGHFSIPAYNFLSFDFNGMVSLFNSTNNFISNPISTFGKINFSFQDVTNNKNLDVVQIATALNTNSQKKNYQDLFSFYTSRDTNLDNRIDSLSFEENQESIQTVFSGSYQKYFDKDTDLNLVIVTQSCNYASNVLDVCVRVPEPSSNVAIFVGFLWFGGISFIPRVMKQIIKLTSQPFIKHIIKSFLIKFWR